MANKSSSTLEDYAHWNEEAAIIKAHEDFYVDYYDEPNDWDDDWYDD